MFALDRLISSRIFSTFRGRAEWRGRTEFPMQFDTIHNLDSCMRAERLGRDGFTRRPLERATTRTCSVT